MIKEINGNIWTFDETKVITTNGNVKTNGSAVMGKGLALQASLRFPFLSEELADKLNEFGNRCFYFSDYDLITFPTKNNWWDDSNLDLIRKSMLELVDICKSENIKKVVMPRPGCKNGRLNWHDVRSKIIDIITESDIEFIICDANI